MNNHILKEDTPVGSIVYTLKGYDPENSSVVYGILGTDVLTVDPHSGEVKLVKPLDREVSETVFKVSPCHPLVLVAWADHSPFSGWRIQLEIVFTQSVLAGMARNNGETSWSTKQVSSIPGLCWEFPDVLEELILTSETFIMFQSPSN